MNCDLFIYRHQHSFTQSGVIIAGRLLFETLSAVTQVTCGAGILSQNYKVG